MTAPYTLEDVARHEAAHATVGIRLEMPVDYSTIVNDGRGRAGQTILISGTIDAWAKLPPASATERFRSYAVMVAAGYVAERERGEPYGTPMQLGDYRGILEAARRLGIVRDDNTGNVTAFRDFEIASMTRAHELLVQDGRAAWHRVAAALAASQHLTGSQIAALVAGGRP